MSSPSSPNIQRLQFLQFTPDRAYYALLLALSAPRPSGRIYHCHDFYEVMWIRSGTGTHYVNGQEVILQAGEILLVRPDDVHEICGTPRVTAINVAFPAAPWRRQGDSLGLGREFDTWEAAPLPPTNRPEGEAMTATAHAFEAALSAFLFGGDRASQGLALSRLWLAVLETLLPSQSSPGTGSCPDWLARALREMQSEENLRGGVARLAQLCAVRPEHLARVMRRDLGQTPTEWVNALRLQRAAGWLLGTTDSIDTIAARCGFANLPHFYRLFTAHYGVPPRRYRLQTRQKLSPKA